MSDREERNLVFLLNINGWAVFVALALTSLVFLSRNVTLGVVVGGLIVTLNLQLLHRYAKRALTPGSHVTLLGALLKYYLRFAVTILFIVLIMSQDLVHPLGLLLGLSVFILDIFILALQATGRHIYHTISKEAV
ncbi:MAG: ATP synthase subunit I [Pseudomonadota bacterium]